MSNRTRLFMQYLIITLLAITISACSTTGVDMTGSYSSYSSNEQYNESMSPYSIAGKNYAGLSRALSFYQTAAQSPWKRIPTGRLLKPGMQDKRIPLLRERLAQIGTLSSYDQDNPLYDDSLAEAVASFQAAHGLRNDAIIGRATIDELNVPPNIRIRQLELNMKRWAKLSKKMNDRYLLVNVPDYQAFLIDHDQKIMEMRVITGKPDRPTPELDSKITRIIFNPYWHVPNKIAAKDILPKLQEDPKYLNDMQIKVFKKEEGNKKTEVADGTVDWRQVQEQDMNYDFRQDPGDKNSLGFVKFEFPNRHNVYLHDTPARNLFDAYPRDFSSGCIRVENPFALVDYLMQDKPEWTNERIDEIIASKRTVYVDVNTPVPIIVTYITAWVDDNGEVNFRPDVYNRDHVVVMPRPIAPQDTTQQKERDPLNAQPPHPTT